MSCFFDKVYSIYFNLRYLPFEQAKYLPLLISRKTKIKGLRKGNLIVSGNDSRKRWSIILGLNGSEGQAKRSDNSIFFSGHGGSICFEGPNTIGQGFSFRIIDSGSLNIGKNNYFNADLTIVCSTSIDIGDRNLFGWNVLIKDDDVHAIMGKDGHFCTKGPILIGDHNWVCSNVTFSKNSEIGCDCVLCANSFVNKKIGYNSSLIGGCPCSVIKENIEWRE